MGRENYIVQTNQFALEGFVVSFGFFGKNVHGSAGDFSALDGGGQSIDFHDVAAREIQENYAVLHLVELLLANDVSVFLTTIHMQTDHVGDTK